MSLVQRRIFYGKVGSGHRLIELMEQGNMLVRGAGLAIKPRVLSDHNSGRTDRIVVEWEAESLQELEAIQTEVPAYPEGPEEFDKFFAELSELIEYAEVETWQVH
jgi:hypothetical protein